MKSFSGILLFVFLFTFIVGALFYFDKLSFHGYATLTGVLKEEPGQQVFLPDFNVSFNLDEETYFKLYDLKFWVKFVPVYNVNTKIRFVDFVLNSSGEVIYSEEFYENIFEETTIERNLDNPVVQKINLAPGEYTFVLGIFYGNSEQKFSKQFKIEKINEFLYSLKQLFDIKLELDSTLLNKPSDLYARVYFTSFGAEPTPVNLTFFVYDEFNKEIYRKDMGAIIETEGVVSEDFSDFKADSGKYKLVLRTLYNVGVEDYFTQDFEIKKRIDFIPFFVLGIILILGIYFIFRKKFKRK